MTQIDARLAFGRGIPASGGLYCQPIARHSESGTVHTRAQSVVPVTAGAVVFALTPGYWEIVERVQGGITRNVLVPDSTSPVLYADLVDVDPTTLAPTATPEAAWQVALEDLAGRMGFTITDNGDGTATISTNS